MAKKTARCDDWRSVDSEWTCENTNCHTYDMCVATSWRRCLRGSLWDGQTETHKRWSQFELTHAKSTIKITNDIFSNEIHSGDRQSNENYIYIFTHTNTHSYTQTHTAYVWWYIFYTTSDVWVWLCVSVLPRSFI